MRMQVLAAAFLVVAGCGVTAQNDRDSSAAKLMRQPGSWRIVHTITAFDASGVTGGMADMAAAGKASVGRPDEGTVCLTAADTAKDTLRNRLNEAMRMGPEWKMVRNAIAGGKVDYAAEMDDPVQGKASLLITGSISPVPTNLVVTTDAHQPEPGQGHIRTVARHEAARLGDY